MRCIQVEIQLQNIYARLTQEAELPSPCMSSYERANVRFVYAALARNTRDLEFGGRRGDVRVEARPRRCDEVHGNFHAGIFLMQFLHVSSNPVHELMIGRAKIGAA